MKRFNAIPLICGMMVSACSVQESSTSQSSKGVCETDEGIVNTYNLIGKWKKTYSSAETPTSKEQREFDYDLLIFEPGTASCMSAIENKALTATIFKASYKHDVASKIFNFLYTAHSDKNQENTNEDVRYSFSGSCSNTVLTLTYPKDGTVEQYQIFSSKVEKGDCN